jgi:SAM-dependent methyltransferase
MENNKTIEWWMEEYGFFGKFYLEGDNSQEGYLQSKKQGLEERTIAEVNGIVKLLGLQNQERILDIPCGYGRHSIELAKRCFKVVGSEINSVHLDKARKSADKEQVRIDFRKENMIDNRYNAEFDAVINMFYSFGFFETNEDNLKVLKNFYNALRLGGKLLFHTDVNVPRILNGKYKEDEERNLASGKKLRIIDKYNPITKRIEGTWIIKNNGDEIKRNYSVRVYTKEEFIDICKEVGFTKFSTYGGWGGMDYSEDSEDMIIIAEK